MLLLLIVVAAASARPGPQGLDVDPGSLQPYQYQYDVNVPETGDQKSHTEERDETGVVVGNFQVVDPTGDLRKLFYRVEGNSGFVITDQQVMVGFTDPPPDPETYSNRQATDGSSQEGGEEGLVDGGDSGTDQGLFSDQSFDGGFSQFGDGSAGFQSGFGGGTDSFSGLPLGDGANSFLNGGSSSSGENGGSSGDSFEGGSSEEGSLSSEEDNGLSELGASGTSGQNRQTGSAQQITSQVAETKKVEPFKFTGPTFTFSIQRTEPNRFEVKERIIGHAVEFDTHGGRARRSAADLH